MDVNNVDARTRLVTWDDPRPMAALRSTMSGLEILKAVIDGRIPRPPMGRLMNIWLAEAERGHIVFEADLGEYHYNPLGMIHGGFAATLLDSAMGCCVHSTLAAGDLYTTIDIKVNYLKALTIETGRVRGVADLIHIGRTTALVEARMLDAAGVVYAHATSTCLIRRA